MSCDGPFPVQGILPVCLIGFTVPEVNAESKQVRGTNRETYNNNNNNNNNTNETLSQLKKRQFYLDAEYLDTRFYKILYGRFFTN
jgi:hypothetical protein